ncbi:MAG: hypothetical protein ACYS8Z_01455 [Planctomycetota bacterium]|jgi:hypothetical protein
MKKQLKAIILCVICTNVLFTAGAIAKEPSVLERAKTVDDRELGELIRIAIENLPETNDLRRFSQRRLSQSGMSREKYAELKNEHEKLKLELRSAEETAKSRVIRSVTEVYAQIKLLDTQIKQTQIKMGSLSKSDAILTELTLAIAELQAKRSTQLAQLREIMNIVPKYAFSHKPANTLNGWLVLDVIGDQICAFKSLRPFGERDSITGYSSIKYPRYTRTSDTKLIEKMSKKQAVEYIKNYIEDKTKHPFRIDITRNTAGKKLSEELHDDIIRTIKAGQLELESVVYLYGDVDERSNFESYFKDGKIYTESRRSNGDLFEGSEQEYIDYHTVRFNSPRYLPRKHTLEFDEDSEELAKRIDDAILLKAKELKVEEFIETRQVLCFEIDTEGMTIFVDSEVRANGEMRANGISYQSFINQTIPEHMKKAQNMPIKYLFLGSRRSVFAEEVKSAIEAAAKEASVQDMFEIE